MAEQNNDLIAGRNAVSEALRSQRSINKYFCRKALMAAVWAKSLLCKAKGCTCRNSKGRKVG